MFALPILELAEWPASLRLAALVGQRVRGGPLRNADQDATLSEQLVNRFTQATHESLRRSHGIDLQRACYR